MHSITPKQDVVRLRVTVGILINNKQNENREYITYAFYHT